MKYLVIFLVLISTSLFPAPIHMAAISTIAEVQHWLANGAGINDRDEDGNTPLHYAVIYGKFEIIRFLVENKAEINVWNKMLLTPMAIAIHNKYFRTVTWLKSHGAYD